MAQFIKVPLARVPPEHLQALLEEYATRDGTDYGSEETSLSERVAQLHSQLRLEKLQLLFDVDCEQWDIVSAEDAKRLLENGEEA